MPTRKSKPKDSGLASVRIVAVQKETRVKNKGQKATLLIQSAGLNEPRFRTNRENLGTLELNDTRGRLHNPS